MEFAVAIAGFSGITIAIQSRDAKTDPVREFRNRNLITWSLCAAVGSALPQGVSYLGAVGAEVWSWSSILYALQLMLICSVPLAGRSKLNAEDRSRLSPVIWIVGIGGTSLLAAILFVNALGWLGEPNPGPMYWGVLWMILFAATQFYRNLFGPGATSAA